MSTENKNLIKITLLGEECKTKEIDWSQIERTYPCQSINSFDTFATTTYHLRMKDGNVYSITAAEYKRLNEAIINWPPSVYTLAEHILRFKALIAATEIVYDDLIREKKELVEKYSHEELTNIRAELEAEALNMEFNKTVFTVTEDGEIVRTRRCGECGNVDKDISEYFTVNKNDMYCPVCGHEFDIDVK